MASVRALQRTAATSSYKTLSARIAARSNYLNATSARVLGPTSPRLTAPVRMSSISAVAPGPAPSVPPSMATGALQPSAQPAWVPGLLDFWFSLGPEEWFLGGPEFDERLRAAYLAVYEDVSSAVPAAAYTDPDTALATIIVLDQLPRNLFRKSARAFATDREALKIAKNVLANGLDAGWDNWRRSFLYLPLVHIENLADQEEALELHKQMGAPPIQIDFCEKHVDIIRRFGRFPHRNECLGRESTAEEVEFLKTAERFGQ